MWKVAAPNGLDRARQLRSGERRRDPPRAQLAAGKRPIVFSLLRDICAPTIALRWRKRSLSGPYLNSGGCWSVACDPVTPTNCCVSWLTVAYSSRPRACGMYPANLQVATLACGRRLGPFSPKIGEIGAGGATASRRPTQLRPRAKLRTHGPRAMGTWQSLAAATLGSRV